MFYLLLCLLLPGSRNAQEQRDASARLRERARVAYDERIATADDIERAD